MPSFVSLFRSEKGNDLVAYLASLRSGEEKQLAEDEWRVSREAIDDEQPAEGRHLYNRYCATCHNPNGITRRKWQSEFIESPAILGPGALQSGQAESPAAHFDHIAQIIKFGVPGSDMAGHEHLSDHDIASLTKWLVQGTVRGHKRN